VSRWSLRLAALKPVSVLNEPPDNFTESTVLWKNHDEVSNSIDYLFASFKFLFLSRFFLFFFGNAHLATIKSRRIILAGRK
jgi:hypothetical protein